jgi:hypothetical protein
MQATDKLIFRHWLAEFDHGFPHAVMRAGHIRIQALRSDELWLRHRFRADLSDVSVKKPVVPQNIQNSFMCMPYTKTAHCLAPAELPADGYLSLDFRFVRQQSRRHRAGVDEYKRCIEELRYVCDLGTLSRIRNWME